MLSKVEQKWRENSNGTHSQISTARGFMNEKSLVGFPLGILNKMEMPKFMKGFVKSMTASLAKLMVKAPIAMSAVPAMSSAMEKNIMIYIFAFLLTNMSLTTFRQFSANF